MTTKTDPSTPTTHVLDVPGVALTYDVRPGPADHPVLLLIGSPMGAAGFTTQAGLFADRTVVTYDPRGVERSVKTGAPMESTPDQHADDLHAIIAAVSGGAPVDVFASSGGAVNALALVARHPSDVRVLVAHEPPTAAVLPDRDAAFAAIEDMRTAYQRQGFGPGMARFIKLVSYPAEIPDDYLAQPAPDPAMFGLPAGDDGSRGDALLEQNVTTCTHYEPDFDAMRAAPTRIVIGIGEDSAGTLAHRGGVEVASRLGLAPVVFPGGHDGFLGGEYGGHGKPAEFGARLRAVLDG